MCPCIANPWDNFDRILMYVWLSGASLFEAGPPSQGGSLWQTLWCRGAGRMRKSGVWWSSCWRKGSSRTEDRALTRTGRRPGRNRNKEESSNSASPHHLFSMISHLTPIRNEKHDIHDWVYTFRLFCLEKCKGLQDDGLNHHIVTQYSLHRVHECVVHDINKKSSRVDMLHY